VTARLTLFSHFPTLLFIISLKVLIFSCRSILAKLEKMSIPLAQTNMSLI